MKWGVLRDHFRGVAWKRLTAHEVDPAVSNGHEFQGVGTLRELLGEEPRREVPAKFVLFADESDETVVVESNVSWYDSRANQPHRSAEWRLYYPQSAGAVQARMRAGDLMVICVTPADEIAVLLARRGSSSEARLSTLFGVGEDEHSTVAIKKFGSPDSLDFTAATVLEELGLGRAELPAGSDLDDSAKIAAELIASHPDALPSGAIVSALTARVVRGVDAIADPDGTLLRWIEAEAAAFRIWEDEKIARRVRLGFEGESGRVDVAAFRLFTMTLRQSRVSRAGGALQYHVARLLDAHGLRYQAQAVTEAGERPDFLFPGAAEYRNDAYPAEQLRVLAVKYTLKERWRQILNEAARVPIKHVLTLDAAITSSGLSSMATANLVVCLPSAVIARYSAATKGRLMSIKQLLATVLAVHQRIG